MRETQSGPLLRLLMAAFRKFSIAFSQHEGINPILFRTSSSSESKISSRRAIQVDPVMPAVKAKRKKVLWLLFFYLPERGLNFAYRHYDFPKTTIFFQTANSYHHRYPRPILFWRRPYRRCTQYHRWGLQFADAASSMGSRASLRFEKYVTISKIFEDLSRNSVFRTEVKP